MLHARKNASKTTQSPASHEKVSILRAAHDAGNLLFTNSQCTKCGKKADPESFSLFSQQLFGILI